MTMEENSTSVLSDYLGLDAIFCKAIEGQSCFGGLLIFQDFKWCIAIESIFEDKAPAPLVAGAVDLYPAKVVEEYQAADAFMELISWP